MASSKKKSKGSSTSFKQQLGKDELAFFNKVAEENFKQQAIAFLNAYWQEVKSQAPFIFNVSWELFKTTDMHFKGVEYVHLYTEGKNLDFDAGLYFFEHMNRYFDAGNNDFTGKEFEASKPVMMTSIARKKELRNKVDVNFDGRVSFLEYLLYQYQEFANPADFCTRSMNMSDEPEEVRKARLELEKVNELIRKYEAKRLALEKASKKSGVKGLGAKNELAQLDSSPLAEELNKLLISAEAAVRIVSKKYKIRATTNTPGGSSKIVQTNGSVYWLEKDIEAKKKKYGKKKK